MADTDTIEQRQGAKLQVASLPPADSGRGLARVPAKVMTALGLTEGDVIEIERQAHHRGARHPPL